MIISEEGIVDENSTGETKVLWSGIQAMKEDDLYLYLYNSAVSAYILPKRDLHQLEEIKTFISSKI